MNITTSADSKPWYRYRGPWLLMLGPFVAVVAGIITIYLAVVSNDGLVDDDYYKQGLAVNQVTERNEQAGTLGLQADIMQSADRAQIRVLLRGHAGTELPESLKLRITHPTRAGVDQDLVLHGRVQRNAGQYAGMLNAPLTGRWHVAVEDDQGKWRLAGDWLTEQDEPLHLPVAVK